MGPPAALTAAREARAVLTREGLRKGPSEDSFQSDCMQRLRKIAAPRGIYGKQISENELKKIGLSSADAKSAHRLSVMACQEEDQVVFVSWLCGLRTDSYVEFSLADSLSDTNHAPTNCKSAAGRDKAAVDRDIALGWTLSKVVRERMACMADNIRPPSLHSEVAFAMPTERMCTRND